jgi:8-oxo-dGTP pyrophosphatase MutT (NUDIX family)
MRSKEKSKSVRKTRPRAQVAALPIQIDREGAVRVLLITSRRSRRWIVPKGWPVKGLKPHAAAAKEAREEAGLIGRIKKRAIGRFDYQKATSDGVTPCRVKVYALRVKRQLKDWPERTQRDARWCDINEAAELVSDPGLALILAELGAASESGEQFRNSRSDRR